jgi:hypothetical protein
MKALEPAPAEPKRKNVPKPQQRQPSLEDKMAALNSKFRVR